MLSVAQRTPQFPMPTHVCSKGPTAAPSVIRAHYKSSYQTIDQYDSGYYEWLPHHDQPRWQAVFMWSGFHMALQHSWAAWCELRDTRIPMKDFLNLLLGAWIASDFATAP